MIYRPVVAALAGLLMAAVPTAVSADGAATGPTAVAGSSGQQLVARAEQLVDEASSVGLDGKVTDAPNHYTASIQLYKNGASSGLITVEGSHAQIIVVANRYYIKGSVGFWSTTFDVDQSQARTLANEWLSLPKSAITGLGANLSMAHLYLFMDLALVAKSTVIGTRSFGTQVTTGVRLAGLGTLWIDRETGKPVDFDGTIADNAVQMRLGRWNAQPAPKAPAHPVSSQSIP